MTRWIVNVTSTIGDERVVIVEAPDRSAAFAAARAEYERLTGRPGIQLSARES